MTLDTLNLFVVAIAAWRLAFLLARERAPFDLMARIRERTTLGGLLTCIYCSSLWSALAMLVLWFTPLQVVVYVFAVSGLALMLGNWTGASIGGGSQ